MSEKITIQTQLTAPIDKVWDFWTLPTHITKWCSGDDSWHTFRATNDLRVGGTFLTRMEAKDGSAGFDFGGIYTDIIPNKRIAYTIGDGRMVEIQFQTDGSTVTIIETFEAEAANSIELQRAGWQHILDNFKNYVLTHTVSI